MTDLAQTRVDVAAAVTAAAAAAGITLSVQPRPVRSSRPLDGWVTVGPVTPARFTKCDARLTVVVLLAGDESKAEERFEQLAVPLVDGVTKDQLHPGDVSCEPVTIPAGDPPVPTFALALTLTLEVD